MTYEAPQITELGSIAEFTRGDKPAIAFDGSTLADLIDAVLAGEPINGLIGTS